MSRTAAGLTMAGVAVFGVIVAVFLALFVFSARDQYGRVAVPGTEVVELPQGKVNVTYEEQVGLGRGDKLDPPGDLSIVIAPADGGEPLDYTPRPGGPSNNTTHSSRIGLGSFDSPAQGAYSVTTAATGPGPGPNVQFGKGFFYSILHGLPLVLLLVSAALFAAGTFVALLPRDERPARPPS
ncbi:MAG: hypothetical protein ABR536_03010 [Solirubrobacterales bacterium]